MNCFSINRAISHVKRFYGSDFKYANSLYFGSYLTSSTCMFASAQVNANSERKKSSSIFVACNFVGFVGSFSKNPVFNSASAFLSIFIKPIGLFFSVNAVGQDKNYEAIHSGKKRILVLEYGRILVGLIGGGLQFLSMLSFFPKRIKHIIEKYVTLAVLPTQFTTLGDGFINKDIFMGLSGVFGILGALFAGKVKAFKTI